MVNQDSKTSQFKILRLGDDFSCCRPFSFTFLGIEYTRTNTWKNFFIKVVEKMFKLDRDRFLSMEENGYMTTRKNKAMYSRNKRDFRSPHLISVEHNLLAETALPANTIWSNLSKVLEYFNIVKSKLEIKSR